MGWVLPRKKGSTNKRTMEFIEAYEGLKDRYNIDPVEVLFKLCKSRNPSIRKQAASELLPYRYPKQASIQLEPDTVEQFEFVWSYEGETIEVDALPGLDKIQWARRSQSALFYRINLDPINVIYIQNLSALMS